MANDRFGVRWGLAGGTMLSTVDQVCAEARWAQEAAFDGLWVSQAMAVDPVVALAAAASSAPDLAELGTSVVPIYGRHPVGLGQAVRTAQSAAGGRFTLGIGASHAAPVNDTMGMDWDRPYSYTVDFLQGLAPLLEGERASYEGEQVTTRAELLIDAAPTPILLAGLGPRMLRLAAQSTQGTTVGQCGPRTIADYVVPTLAQAAEDAQLQVPRLMALVRICVTDDHGAAYAVAKEVSAFYSALPSYAQVLAREGLDHPADLHLIGSWDHVLDGLAQYAEAGVTDLRIEVSAPNEHDRAATRDALAVYLATAR